MSDFQLEIKTREDGLVFVYTSGPRKTIWDLTKDMTLLEVRALMTDFLEGTAKMPPGATPWIPNVIHSHGTNARTIDRDR